MAIDRVSLRVQSTSMTGAEVAAIFDDSPTRLVEKGTPISPRSRSNLNLHSVTTAVFESDGAWGELGPFLEAFRLLFANIESHSSRALFTADLVIALSARSGGYMLDLTSDEIGLLAGCGCGVLIDVYNE